MADFLLELRCEEIPARMQAKASADLARLFAEHLAEAGLRVESITSYVTPRRLALIAKDMPESTETVSEEFKGPRTTAPTQALEGFLRKVGLNQDELDERDGVWFAIVEKPGRPAIDLLAEAIPAVIRAFPWPKSMRWGEASITTESLRWVRPLQGIVALLGNEVVPFEVEGVASGRDTMGHRFHSSRPVAISSSAAYAEALRAAYVIVDQEERAAIIQSQAMDLAQRAGLTLIEDAGLVAENAGLTEWPVPLLGKFDPDFLEVPPEVIQLTLRINQKYLVLRDKAGKLAPAFICTANIDAKDDGAAIVAGNGKVLAARLSDARFFWEQDKKTKLAEHAKKLERITFHEKLGTVADKVERVAKLARWLVEEGIVKGADPDEVEQAARLCKADLVTEMVGEFPELQGLMGGYYARAEGLSDAIADAIRDHYKPVGQGDDVPIAPVTVAVSLADKLDTLSGFFDIDEKPTGSRDPFALRRAALGAIQIITANALRFAVARGDLLDFFADRLKVQQKEAGVRHDLIDAVFALGQETGQIEDDLVRLLARVRALQSFITTDDGENLLAGYKRAANILKKEGGDAPQRHAELGSASIAATSEKWTLKQVQGDDPAESQTGEEDPGVALDDPDVAEAMRAHHGAVQPLPYAPEPAEAALIAALDAAEPRAEAAVGAEDFEGAMAALASLRAPIDAFFDHVTVNDEDQAKRSARLALLRRVRAAVHKFADFSRIAG